MTALGYCLDFFSNCEIVIVIPRLMDSASLCRDPKKKGKINIQFWNLVLWFKFGQRGAQSGPGPNDIGLVLELARDYPDGAPVAANLEVPLDVLDDAGFFQCDKYEDEMYSYFKKSMLSQNRQQLLQLVLREGPRGWTVIQEPSLSSVGDSILSISLFVVLVLGCARAWRRACFSRS